jgi:PA14 domain-containing protein
MPRCLLPFLLFTSVLACSVPAAAEPVAIPAAARVAPPARAPGQGLLGRLWYPRRGISSLERMRQLTDPLAPAVFFRLPALSFSSLPQEPLGKALGGAVPLPPVSDLLERPAGTDWCIELRGYLNVPKPGVHDFSVRADDGAGIVIGGRSVLKADQEAWNRTFTGQVSFSQPGLYPIEVRYFQGIIDARLEVKGLLFGPGSLYDAVPGVESPRAEATLPAAVDAQGGLGAQVLLDAAPSKTVGDAVFTWNAGGRRLAEGRCAWALLPPGEQSVILDLQDRGGRSITVRTVLVRPGPAAAPEVKPHTPESPLSIPPEASVGALPSVPGAGLFGRIWDVNVPFEDFEDLDRVTPEAGPSGIFQAGRIDFPPGPALVAPAAGSLREWLGEATAIVKKEDKDPKTNRLLLPVGDMRLFEFTGCIRIDASGEVLFDVNSDDGFQLWIGGRMICEAPRPRPPSWTTGRVRFHQPGLHPIRLRYFQWMGGAGITLTSSLPGGEDAPGPQGRTVVSKALLYAGPPGSRPPRPAFQQIPAALAQGPLGSQVLLDGTRSADPDGQPLELTWWLDGNKVGTGAKTWALLPVGAHRIRLEAWDGGLPVQVTDRVTVKPGVEAVSFALPGEQPRVHPRGRPLPLSFRLVTAGGKDLAPGSLRCELALRHFPRDGGSGLVGPRARPVAFHASAVRWEYVLQTGGLPPGRYRVEARILDEHGSILEQVTGGFLLR